MELQYPGIQFSQFDGAELLAEKYEITRDELDAFALSSHQRAWEATQKGYFEKEIVPLNIKLEDGTADVHKVDEGIRPEASLEGLQGLNVLREGGVITAGSASQISDGAAAILIANEGAVKKHGLQVRAKIHSLAVVGSAPVKTPASSISATARPVSSRWKAITTRHSLSPIRALRPGLAAFCATSSPWARAPLPT